MADSFLDNIDLAKLSAYLSGSAKASAAGNEAEGQYLNARDLIKSHLYGTQSTAATAANAQGLNNAKFATSLPSQGAGEAVRGSLIQNSQDAGIDLGNNRANVVNFTGGTRPSSFTPETRQAGADLIKHGQSLIADPGSFVPAQQSVAAPALSEEPKAGFWGKAAGATGAATGLLSALGGGKNGAGGAVPLGDIIDWLKHFGNNTASEADSPQTQEEDTRGLTGETGGTAYGPDGEPLPVDNPPLQWWQDGGETGGYEGGDLGGDY